MRQLTAYVENTAVHIVMVGGSSSTENRDLNVCFPFFLIKTRFLWIIELKVKNWKYSSLLTSPCCSLLTTYSLYTRVDNWGCKEILCTVPCFQLVWNRHIFTWRYRSSLLNWCPYRRVMAPREALENLFLNLMKTVKCMLLVVWSWTGVRHFLSYISVHRQKAACGKHRLLQVIQTG